MARIAPVEMVQRRFGYFPKTFYLRKQEHNVKRVERMWVKSKKGEPERHYFDVSCEDGTFELYQDLSNNTWYGKRTNE